VARFGVPDHARATPRPGAGSAWLAVALLPSGGCAGPLSSLDPAGPHARDVAQLWWVMLTGAVLILAGVMALALFSLRRRRPRPQSGRPLLVGGGLAFPVAVLTALLGWALLGGERLLAGTGGGVPEMRAHATRFAWAFAYPDGGRTVNVLHVPVGQPFRLLVTSEDVIHAFWVPRLGGKIDAVPGKRNRIELTADRPGVYLGTCAEYCGVGHAHMSFRVEAHAPADYAAALRRADAAPPPILLDAEREPPVPDRLRAAFEHVLRWLGWRS
jgi:cytochrome c oxidase subunit 2